jgi:hypothetical protein
VKTTSVRASAAASAGVSSSSSQAGTGTGAGEGPSSLSSIYSSSGDARHDYAGGATHVTEVDTAQDKDSRTVFERTAALQESGLLDADPGVYRGATAYRSFAGKDPPPGGSKMSGTQGPIRAPSFVRSSARFDYQVGGGACCVYCVCVLCVLCVCVCVCCRSLLLVCVNYRYV